ncbi:unnamed protein product [Closterium sp. Yama58-4]|nr:unnamed protein product [Closterium sp. Yama58-4]
MSAAVIAASPASAGCARVSLHTAGSMAAIRLPQGALMPPRLGPSSAFLTSSRFPSCNRKSSSFKPHSILQAIAPHAQSQASVATVVDQSRNSSDDGNVNDGSFGESELEARRNQWEAERLRLIKDATAAAVSSYEERIARIEVDQTAEIATMRRVAEIEGQVMRRQSQEMSGLREEIEALTNELVLTKEVTEHVMKQRSRREEELAEIKAQIAAQVKKLERRRVEVEEERAKLKAEVARVEAEEEEAEEERRAEEWARLQGDVSRAEELQRREQEEGEVREGRGYQAGEAAGSETAVWLSAALEGMKTEREQHQPEVATAMATAAELSGRVASFESSLLETRRAIETTRASLFQAKLRAEEKSAVVRELRSQLEKVEQERESVDVESFRELTAQLADARRILEEEDRQQKEMAALLGRMTKEIPGLEMQLAEVREALAEERKAREQEVGNLRESVAVARADAAEARVRLVRAEAPLVAALEEVRRRHKEEVRELEARLEKLVVREIGARRLQGLQEQVDDYMAQIKKVDQAIERVVSR